MSVKRAGKEYKYEYQPHRYEIGSVVGSYFFD